MVTGRPAEGVRRGRGPTGHQVSGRERAVDSRTGGLPGTGTDQGHRVVAELSGAAVGRGGAGQWHALGHRRRREHVGHDAVLADQVVVRPLRPLRVDRPEVVDERRRMDAAQDVVTVRLGFDPLVVGQRVEDPIDPLRQLGAVGRTPTQTSRIGS